jgi:DNA anti-recombination protein RmuC
MPLRTIVLLLVLLGLAVFAMLNWNEFTRPSVLRLGLGTVEAPLGLIMLGLTALLSIVFLVFVTYLQTSFLIDSRRHARDLQAQRELADQAEASRYHQLHSYIELELQRLAERSEQAQNRMSSRLEQMDRELRGVIEQSSNSLAAYIGELDDRFQRQFGGDDKSKPV